MPDVRRVLGKDVRILVERFAICSCWCGGKCWGTSGRMVGSSGFGEVISPWSRSPIMRPLGSFIAVLEILATIIIGLEGSITEGCPLRLVNKEGCSEGWNT